MQKIKACGHYLIVELEPAADELVSAGGIVLATGIDSKKKEQAGMSYAKVVDIGRNCWVGHYDAEGNHNDWAEVDDRVMIAKYAGQAFPIPDGSSKADKATYDRLRLIKDDDVLAVVGGDE